MADMYKNRDEFLTDYVTKNPQYATWDKDLLYGTIVKWHPDTPAKIEDRKSRIPAIQSSVDYLRRYRTVHPEQKNLSDEQVGEALSKYPEMSVWSFNKPITTQELSNQIVKDTMGTEIKTPQWVGRPLRAPITTLDGGDRYVKLVGRQNQGKAGFLENLSPDEEDIPFIGGGFLAAKAISAVRTVKKLQNDEDPSDQELLDLNLFLMERDRESNSNKWGIVGSIVRQSFSFGLEIAGTMLTAGMGLAAITGKKVAKEAAEKLAEKEVKGFATKVAEKAAAEAATRQAKGFLAQNTIVGRAAVDTIKESVEKATQKMLGNVAGESAKKTFLAKTVGYTVAGAAAGAATTAVRDPIQAIMATSLTGEAGLATAEQYRLYDLLQGKPENNLRSYALGIATDVIESGTEFMGEGLKGGAKFLFKQLPETNFMYRLGKTIADKYNTSVRTPIVKFGEQYKLDVKDYLTNKAPKIVGMSALATMKAAKWGADAATTANIFRNLGYDGMFEEFGEERLAGFLEGLIGAQGPDWGPRNALKQMMPTGEQAFAELVAFAAPMVWTNSVRATSNILNGVYDGDAMMGAVAFRRGVNAINNRAIANENDIKAVETAVDVGMEELKRGSDKNVPKVINFIADVLTFPATLDLPRIHFGSFERMLEFTGNANHLKLMAQMQHALRNNGVKEEDLPAAVKKNYKELLFKNFRTQIDPKNETDRKALEALEAQGILTRDADRKVLYSRIKADNELAKSARELLTKYGVTEEKYLEDLDSENASVVQNAGGLTADELMSILNITKASSPEAIQAAMITYNMARPGAGLSYLSPNFVEEYNAWTSNVKTLINWATDSSRLAAGVPVQHKETGKRGVVAQVNADTVTVRYSDSAVSEEVKKLQFGDSWEKMVPANFVLTSTLRAVGTKEEVLDYLMSRNYGELDKNLTTKIGKRNAAGEQLYAFTPGAYTRDRNIFFNLNAGPYHVVEDYGEMVAKTLGLLEFDPKTEKFRLSDEAMGLMSKMISGMPEDAQTKMIKSAPELFLKIMLQKILGYNSKEYGHVEELPYTKLIDQVPAFDALTQERVNAMLARLYGSDFNRLYNPMKLKGEVVQPKQVTPAKATEAGAAVKEVKQAMRIAKKEAQKAKDQEGEEAAMAEEVPEEEVSEEEVIVPAGVKPVSKEVLAKAAQPKVAELGGIPAEEPAPKTAAQAAELGGIPAEEPSDVVEEDIQARDAAEDLDAVDEDVLNDKAQNKKETMSLQDPKYIEVSTFLTPLIKAGIDQPDFPWPEAVRNFTRLQKLKLNKIVQISSLNPNYSKLAAMTEELGTEVGMTDVALLQAADEFQKARDEYLYSKFGVRKSDIAVYNTGETDTSEDPTDAVEDDVGFSDTAKVENLLNRSGATGAVRAFQRILALKMGGDTSKAKTAINEAFSDPENKNSLQYKLAERYSRYRLNPTDDMNFTEEARNKEAYDTWLKSPGSTGVKKVLASYFGYESFKVLYRALTSSQQNSIVVGKITTRLAEKLKTSAAGTQYKDTEVTGQDISLTLENNENNIKYYVSKIDDGFKNMVEFPTSAVAFARTDDPSILDVKAFEAKVPMELRGQIEKDIELLKVYKNIMDEFSSFASVHTEAKDANGNIIPKHPSSDKFKDVAAVWVDPKSIIVPKEYQKETAEAYQKQLKRAKDIISLRENVIAPFIYGLFNREIPMDVLTHIARNPANNMYQDIFFTVYNSLSKKNSIFGAEQQKLLNASGMSAESKAGIAKQWSLLTRHTLDKKRLPANTFMSIVLNVLNFKSTHMGVGFGVDVSKINNVEAWYKGTLKPLAELARLRLKLMPQALVHKSLGFANSNVKNIFEDISEQYSANQTVFNYLTANTPNKVPMVPGRTAEGNEYPERRLISAAYLSLLGQWIALKNGAVEAKTKLDAYLKASGFKPVIFTGINSEDIVKDLNGKERRDPVKGKDISSIDELDLYHPTEGFYKKFYEKNGSILLFLEAGEKNVRQGVIIPIERDSNGLLPKYEDVMTEYQNALDNIVFGNLEAFKNVADLTKRSAPAMSPGMMYLQTDDGHNLPYYNTIVVSDPDKKVDGGTLYTNKDKMDKSAGYKAQNRKNTLVATMNNEFVLSKGNMIPDSAIKSSKSFMAGIAADVAKYNEGKDYKDQIHIVSFEHTAKKLPKGLKAVTAGEAIGPANILKAPFTAVLEQQNLDSDTHLHKLSIAVQLISNSMFHKNVDQFKQALADLYKLNREALEKSIKAGDFALTKLLQDEYETLNRLISEKQLNENSVFVAAFKDKVKMAAFIKAMKPYLNGFHGVLASGADSPFVRDSEALTLDSGRKVKRAGWAYGKPVQTRGLTFRFGKYWGKQEIANAKEYILGKKMSSKKELDAMSALEFIKHYIVYEYKAHGRYGDFIDSYTGLVNVDKLTINDLRFWEIYENETNPITGEKGTVYIPGSFFIGNTTPGTGPESHLFMRWGLEPKDDMGNIILVHKDIAARGGRDFDGDKYANYMYVEGALSKLNAQANKVLLGWLQHVDGMPDKLFKNVIDTDEWVTNNTVRNKDWKDEAKALLSANVGDFSKLEVRNVARENIGRTTLGAYVATTGSAAMAAANNMLSAIDTGKEINGLSIKRSELSEERMLLDTELAIRLRALTNVIVDNPTKMQASYLGLSKSMASYIVAASYYLEPKTGLPKDQAQAKKDAAHIIDTLLNLAKKNKLNTMYKGYYSAKRLMNTKLKYAMGGNIFDFHGDRGFLVRKQLGALRETPEFVLHKLASDKSNYLFTLGNFFKFTSNTTKQFRDVLSAVEVIQDSTILINPEAMTPEDQQLYLKDMYSLTRMTQDPTISSVLSYVMDLNKPYTSELVKSVATILSNVYDKDHIYNKPISRGVVNAVWAIKSNNAENHTFRRSGDIKDSFNRLIYAMTAIRSVVDYTTTEAPAYWHPSFNNLALVLETAALAVHELQLQYPNNAFLSSIQAKLSAGLTKATLDALTPKQVEEVETEDAIPTDVLEDDVPVEDIVEDVVDASVVDMAIKKKTPWVPAYKKMPVVKSETSKIVANDKEISMLPEEKLESIRRSISDLPATISATVSGITTTWTQEQFKAALFLSALVQQGLNGFTSTKFESIMSLLPQDFKVKLSNDSMSWFDMFGKAPLETRYLTDMSQYVLAGNNKQVLGYDAQPVRSAEVKAEPVVEEQKVTQMPIAEKPVETTPVPSVPVKEATVLEKPITPVKTFEKSERIVQETDIKFMRSDKILPTVEQAAGLDKVADFIRDTKQNMSELAGYAGSGKTTLVENIVRFARSEGLNVAVWAPTNKAASVLQSKLSAGNVRVVASTIHKGLYGAPKKGVWKPHKIENSTLIIIDEASMLTKSIYDDIKTKLNDSIGSKILFIGDNFQIEPVGEPSHVLDPDKSPIPNKYSVRLKGVLRQAADSNVLSTATEVRKENKPLVPAEPTEDMRVIKNKTEFVEAYKSALKASPAETVMLVATNPARKQYNQLARTTLFGENAKTNTLLKTEQLISVANSTSISNSETFKVVDPGTVTARFTVEVKSVRSGTSDIIPIERRILMLDTGAETGPTEEVVYFVPTLNIPSLYHTQIREGLSSKDFHLLDSFGDIEERGTKTVLARNVIIATYGYSMTAHKAQGSQWRDVFIDQNYVSPNWNAARWYYTALTRTSNRATVFPVTGIHTPFDLNAAKKNLIAEAPVFITRPITPKEPGTPETMSLQVTGVDNGVVSLDFTGKLTPKAQKLYLGKQWTLEKALTESGFRKSEIEFIKAVAPDKSPEEAVNLAKEWMKGQMEIIQAPANGESQGVAIPDAFTADDGVEYRRSGVTWESRDVSYGPPGPWKAVNADVVRRVWDENGANRALPPGSKFYEHLSVNKGQGEYKEYYIRGKFPVPGQHDAFRNPNLLGWFRVREYLKSSISSPQKDIRVQVSANEEAVYTSFNDSWVLSDFGDTPPEEISQEKAIQLLDKVGFKLGVTDKGTLEVQEVQTAMATLFEFADWSDKPKTLANIDAALKKLRERLARERAEGKDTSATENRIRKVEEARDQAVDFDASWAWNGPNNETFLMNVLGQDKTHEEIFVNAITQDAKNKGFTKVRFPTGETAAKVEGHQVLADRLRDLDNRLSLLETDVIEKRSVLVPASAPGFPSYEYVWNGVTKTWTLANFAGDENWSRKGLSDAQVVSEARRDLLNARQELKAQGIEKLTPIEAFYENRVGKIVNQMGAVPVTDTNGNTWREVAVTTPETMSLSAQEEIGYTTPDYVAPKVSVPQALNRGVRAMAAQIYNYDDKRFSPLVKALREDMRQKRFLDIFDRLNTYEGVMNELSGFAKSYPFTWNGMKHILNTAPLVERLETAAKTSLPSRYNMIADAFEVVGPLGDDKYSKEEQLELSFSMQKLPEALVYNSRLFLYTMGSKSIHRDLMVQASKLAAIMGYETERFNKTQVIFGLTDQLIDTKTGKRLKGETPLNAKQKFEVEQFMWLVSAMRDNNRAVDKILDNASMSDEQKRETLMSAFDELNVAWGNSILEKDSEGKTIRTIEPVETISAALKRWYASEAFAKLSKFRTKEELDWLPIIKEERKNYKDVISRSQMLSERIVFPDSTFGFTGSNSYGHGLPTPEVLAAKDIVTKLLNKLAKPKAEASLMSERSYVREKGTPAALPPATEEQKILLRQLYGPLWDELNVQEIVNSPKFNMYDANAMIKTELWNVLIEKAASGQNMETPEVNKILNTFKLISKQLDSYKYKEWAATATFSRKLKGSQAEIYEYTKEMRRADGTTLVRKSRTMNFATRRLEYMTRVFNAEYNQLLMRSFALTPDFDGSPLMIPVPSTVAEAGELYTEDIWNKISTNLSRSLNVAVPASGEKRAVMSALVDHINRDAYVKLDSPFKSLEVIYVKKGEAADIVKHLVQTEKEWFVMGFDVFNAWKRVAQFSKILTVGWSLFFPYSLIESAVAGTGMKNNALWHPIQNAKEVFKYWKDIRSYDERSMELREVFTEGFVQLGSSAVLGQDISETDRLMSKIADRVRLRWGEKKAEQVKQAMRIISGQILSDYFFGKPGRAGWFPALKLWASERYAIEVAREQGLDWTIMTKDQKVTLIRGIADQINAAYGGTFWHQYTWATPQMQQLLNASLFAPPWTWAAWQIAGGGLLTGPILEDYVSASNAKFIARNWTAMALINLIAIPNALQFAIWMSAGGDDDPKFTFSNETGRKGYVDVTALARLSPWYEGAPTGKRRVYLRFGKQSYEVIDGWFDDPFAQLMRKLSQPAKAVLEQVTGRSPGSDFDLEFQGQGLKGWFMTEKEGIDGFLGSRFGYLAQKVLPMSLLSLAKYPEAGIAVLLAPVSKGMSQSKAIIELTAELNTLADKDSWKRIQNTPRLSANLAGLIRGTLEAAEKNGYDVSKVINTAKGVVLSGLYKQFMDAMESNDTDRMNDLADRIIRVNGTAKGLQTSISNRRAMSGRGKISEPEKQVIQEMLKPRIKVAPAQVELPSWAKVVPVPKQPQTPAQ